MQGDAKVTRWMETKNLTAMGVLGYFQQRIQTILAKHGKKAMFWCDRNFANCFDPRQKVCVCRDEFWAADLPALPSTAAEIRGTTFAQTLSAGREALTTGIDEAW
eukprot:COSAG01_NODE_23312_length_820_cov_0.766990_2_plen_104_part_01